MVDMLAGRVALVTDGVDRLGAEVAQRLAQEGAHVAIGYTGLPDPADALAHDLERHGVQGAVFKSDRIERLAELVASRFGRLDVVVDQTGASRPCQAVAATMDELPCPLQAVIARLGNGGRVISIGRQDRAETGRPMPGGRWKIAMGVVQPATLAARRPSRRLVPVAAWAASFEDVAGTVAFLAGPRVGPAAAMPAPGRSMRRHDNKSVAGPGRAENSSAITMPALVEAS
ncbi:MAG TPA: SDR family oxidoreductase [Geminicoccus sp.]|jgi:NAD(P)-dependent dehydrogenase (short-subunit alcohol dehydrogenase family)|uniref:SDR family oxidoreductase n=1 Tax=Geminicoccus sp. TaxID=2024832 RepID=UPI002E317E57|nr:SDR family oxidoreductase [Geminicoccus sp.]HEX2525061.1 SDR family oxidoreductase [Geminicoccus sp.]